MIRYCAIVAAMSVAVAVAPAGLAAEDALLFSYFGDQAAGLLLAYSRDGYTFTALNDGKPYLVPQVGEHKLLRDPCIAKGADGLFHMVWTTSWGERGIGYANSSDLIHWSPQRFLPVMHSEPDARNCWAPEILWDGTAGEWLIFWASTIPGRFPETDTAGDDGYNHRMYVARTKDFADVSAPEMFYDHGFNVIDATIVKDGSRFVMFLKDETRHPPAKNIRMATSDFAAGPYGAPSAPITGAYWAEGPTAIKVGTTWLVYFDKYVDGTYGAVASDDLVTWRDISADVHFPEGARHGTVFRVSEVELQRLIGGSEAIADTGAR